MRVSDRCRDLLGLFLLLGSAAALTAAQPPVAADKATDDSVTRGLRKPATATGPLSPYRKTWALVVGIDYRERTDVERLNLPPLRNAQRDAQAIADSLRTLYGYEPVVLLGPQATAAALLAELEKFRDREVVQADDAVLIYFSGHGARIDDATEQGVIYPFDVVLKQGRPGAKFIRLHSDLVAALESSPARHKLVVLDSCHSGEIFSRAARPPSVLGGPVPAELAAEPVLQALASCRGSQVASDGLRGENSPFTAALIRALQRLPAREIGSQKSPITTSRLFVSMRSDLKSLRGGQSPDCRRLVNGEGEFLFWPQKAADFTPYADSVEDFELLQAMVPGEHGKWWFDEMPWFIPSLRRMILEGKARQRGVEQESAINRDNLLALAEMAVLEADKVDDPLIKMRVSQFRRLRSVEERGRLRDEVAKIAAELTATFKEPAGRPALEATDLHLLAVLQHYLALNHPATATTSAPGDAPGATTKEVTNPQATYADALNLYGEAEGRDRALAALCHCDLGNYLLEERREWLRAAREFEAALVPFQSETASMSTAKAEPTAASFKEIPPAFHIYTLCRQADSWQRQNRWGEADRCLEDALSVTQNFATQHDLMAVVQKRMAWSHMEQWRIEEAQRSFQESNRILVSLARKSLRNAAGAANLRPAIPGVSEAELESVRTQEFEDLVNHDYDAAIDYLHNQHGLAMASRFQGSVAEASASYRWITEKLSVALSRLSGQKSGGAVEVPTDVEPRLVERLINTQERLGDCNLFGDPAVRDIKEAADDYRRALGWVGRIPAGRRTTLQATLLFKQALAVAIPSSIQDVAYAEFLCREAQQLLDKSAGAKSPPLATLGALAPAVVRVCGTRADDLQEDEDELERLACLRQAILEWMGAEGQTLHRDQLELLLFASRLLVEQGDSRERFQAARDADFLLAFCRQALLRGDVARPTSASFHPRVASGGRESRTYLRPYYDAVMRTRLASHPKHVKELLEIHWEATRGMPYVKPEQANAILAVYLLDGKGWIFLDVPRGASKFIPLDGHCSEGELKLACGSEKSKLPLPLEIVKELAGLAAAPTHLGAMPASSASSLPLVECWWQDPVRGMQGEGEVRQATRSHATEKTEGDGAPLRVITRRPRLDEEFPFALPENVRRRP